MDDLPSPTIYDDEPDPNAAGIRQDFGDDALPMTRGEVAELRKKAILALREYRKGLVAIKALKPATDRVDNALNYLGA